ncbi:alpha/beta hydrolase family protein [Paracoccus acridae]|uniref:alpha/beta hydrolase family protein n=1 Tax=Paracoccus acridae TaxID=1795310 RepID=UPI001664044C|nr:alpha/beta hydrolase family protein [Paracoccus acridae]
MFYKWLDHWEERRAQRGDEGKKVTDVVLAAELAFPGAGNVASIADFCDLADRAVADPSYFDEPIGSELSFEAGNGWISFPSDISTETDENNTVFARITKGRSFDHALVVFHHWNARSRNDLLAKSFARQDITVVEIALPYHLERKRPGSSHADYMLSANLGRTIRSVRQGVLDGRKLIRWLRAEGYKEISVLGISLGSWVAGLIAAHDPTVRKAALFLTAGSLADMVWTGRATQSIRASLEPAIKLPDLNRAWGPVNLENYTDRLARPELDILVVLALRDKVVLPELSKRFVDRLNDAGAKLDLLEANCGHYSLSIPPYVIQSGRRLRALLCRRP